jgi:hypothetical protein
MFCRCWYLCIDICIGTVIMLYNKSQVNLPQYAPQEDVALIAGCMKAAVSNR